MQSLKAESRRLNASELRVLQYAAQGLEGREIAFKMGVSQTTVKRVLANIYEKLDAVNRAHAVAKAMASGIILYGERDAGHAYLALFEQHKPSHPLLPETPLEHLGILMYQVGHLARSIMCMHWNPNDVAGYRSEAFLAVADSTAQEAIICELLGLNFSEAVSIGYEHLEERLREARAEYEKSGVWR